MFYKVVKRGNPIKRNVAKFYAAPFFSGELSIKDLSKDISDACTLNVTDVEAVLSSLVRKLPVYLRNGFRIQLGSFGRMRLSFSSKGSDDEKSVDAASITGTRIIFTPCTEMKKEVESASYTRINLAVEEAAPDDGGTGDSSGGGASGGTN